MNTLNKTVVVPDYPATGESVTVAMQGMIVGVGVKYNLGPYSSALDFAIIEVSDNQPDQDILAISGGNTDGWFYPARQNCDNSGVAIANLFTRGMPVFGDVLIELANAVPGDSVDFVFHLTE